MSTATGCNCAVDVTDCVPGCECMCHVPHVVRRGLLLRRQKRPVTAPPPDSGDAGITWDTLPARSWPENMQPTPEQLAEWMVALSRDELVWYLGQHLWMRERQIACFVRDHEGQIADLTAEVERLRLRWQEAWDIGLEHMAERYALQRQVDAVKALHRRDGQGRKGRERCYHCHFAYPCPTVRAADPQRPAQAPENAQEPRTPAPGSPSTPETLSGPLSAPDRGTA